MIKKILCALVLTTLLLESAAFAENAGEVIFRDALYGTAIGAILGGAVYLMDDKDLGEKLGIGIAVGTLGGLVFGVSETRGAVTIRNGKTTVGVPAFYVQKKNGGTSVETKLLKVEF